MDRSSEWARCTTRPASQSGPRPPPRPCEKDTCTRCSVRIASLSLSDLLALAATWPAAEAGAVTIGLTPAALSLLGDDGAPGTKINHGAEIIDDQPGLREGSVGVAGNTLEIKLVGEVTSAALGCARSRSTP